MGRKASNIFSFSIFISLSFYVIYSSFYKSNTERRGLKTKSFTLSSPAIARYSTNEAPNVKKALYIMNERILLVLTDIRAARREETPSPYLEAYRLKTCVIGNKMWF